jgi:hypothetical protein
MPPKKPIDFSGYPDIEVLYMGVPHPKSKFVDGVWYYRTLDGDYRPFPFQENVRYRLTKKKPDTEEGSR